ncbi:acyl-CoA thioesterase [Herbiconiux sp. L3-i23]|uniref:acyl-CoA thioesterase n=1 Tax=Herbiconiux sp. L3-i23 TaxID=2905871 RepID=UPI0035312B97
MNPIRRFLRLLWLSITAKRRPRLGIHDVARMSARVWPTDLDELRHVNNGVYLSMMDHPRLDLLQRSGVWAKMQQAGVYPVVASQTITYRKSLKLWQRYDIESRIIGYDERAVFVEQRFVVGGEIYARAIVKGRFLRRTGGVVGTAELAELTGIDTASMPVPAWLHDWSEHVALPSTRQPAPSLWD